MDFIQRMIRYFAVVRRQLRRHRRLVVAAAAVVVFATTYALILPAITLDEQTASDQPGIELGQATADAQNGTAEAAADAQDGTAEATADAQQATEAEASTDDAAATAGESRQAAEAATKDADGTDTGQKDADTADDAAASEDGEATSTLTYQGDGYSFSVAYDPDSGIPEGSTLRVTEVTGSDRDSYVRRTNDLVYGGASEGSVTFARYFDVTIIGPDGSEVEPAEPVRVTAAVDGSDAITGDVNVLHFTQDGGEETIPADREADGSVSYEQSSFSVVGLYEAPSLLADAGATVLASDEAVEAPAHSKTLKDNGDGTYDLTLSVTGRSSSSTTSNKVDVVVVFDTSASMAWPAANYSPTGQYGYWGQFYQLYRRSGGSGRYTYTEISNDDGYSGTAYYYANDQYNLLPSNAFRYTSDQGGTETRLAVAKTAVNGLAEQLLGNNNGDTDVDTANVTLSLVTFSSVATTQIQRTATLSEFQGAVNATGGNGYTNWQDALSKAKAVSARDGATKYVVFVSDGNPSVYGRNGDTYAGGTRIETNEDNVATCYNQAVSELSGDDTNFYGVGVFGNVTRMQSLVTAAGSDASTHYQSATDTASLNAAFDNIIKSITNSSTFRNVKLTDSLTSLTSTGLSYTGNSAIEGISGFTYARNGVAWSDAPVASYTDGTISWDLGNTTVENGVTYSVTCKVWPSQAAMDLVADLNNEKTAYDSLSDAQKAMVTDKDSSGVYHLNTNTASGNGVSYTAVETTKDSSGNTTETTTNGTANFNNPDPIPIATSQVTVRKAWDPSAPSGTKSVVLTVTDGDGGTQDVDVTLSADGWTGTAYVAPGLRVTKDGTSYTLESGHDYGVSEQSGIDNFTFEAGDGVHPMLVDSATEVRGSDGKALCELVGTNRLVGLKVAILKTASGTTTALPGAEFKLYAQGADGSRGDQVTADADGSSVGAGDDHVIATDGDGTATVGRLAQGTYQLVETKAPDGYDMLANPVVVVVDGRGVTYAQTGNSASANGVTVEGNGSAAVYTITVTNSTGEALPDTGGTGTAAFALAGAALVTLALLGLALRREAERGDA